MPPPGTAELCLDVTTEGTTLLIAPVIKADDGWTPSRCGSSAPRATASSTPTGSRPTRASLPGSGSPGSPTRCPRSCSSWHSPTSGLWCPRPSRPRSCPGTTRGCAVRPRDLVGRLVHRAGDLRAVPRGPCRLRARDIASTSAGSGPTRSAVPSCGPARAGRDPFRDPEAEARILAGIGLPPGALGVPHEATARALPQGFGAGPFGAGPFGTGPFGQDRRYRTVQHGPFGAGPSGRSGPVHRGQAGPASRCAALTPWRSPPRCCRCCRPRRRAGRVNRPVPDYREAGGSPEIGLSTAEPTRARLVRPRRHGHRRGPRGGLRRLFLALSKRQSHMLLPTAPTSAGAGARRATTAHRGGPRAAGRRWEALRISRFQAGLWEELQRSASSTTRRRPGRAGPRADRRRRDRASPYPHGQRAAPAVPAGGVPLAGVPVSPGSAASWPTTWGSARPCRPWR